MEEIPEEAIREAETEAAPPAHGHEEVSGENGTLRSHLEDVHGLDVPSSTSPSTQAGLHDRLHGDTAAADE